MRIVAKGKGKAGVIQSRKAARSLSAYLALPVEQYSLLDPTWIERCPAACAYACMLQGFLLMANTVAGGRRMPITWHAGCRGAAPSA